MNSIFLIYKTDVHHSYASRDLIGVGTTKRMAIKLCREQAKKEHQTFSEDDLYNLENISQTQGYEGGGEFHFEEVNVGVIL